VSRVPTLSYTAGNFPPQYGNALAGAHDLAITWPELVWAAISVGRAELLHLMRFGPFSTFEIVYRAALVFANLKERPDGNIIRSEAYDGLDPSEKGAVSYFLGLTIAKLVADRLLSVPWLMHLDVYRHELQPVLQSGETRPDLVGQTIGGQWVAIESKGRTNGRDTRALERAKEQVEALVSVGGVAPALRIALQTHFESGVLNCTLDDPEETKSKRRLDIPLSRPKLFEGYYRPFREWLKEAPDTRRQTFRARRFRVADFRDVDLSVGLDEGLLNDDPPAAGVGEGREHVAEERRALGRDGILVNVGELWTAANMQLEPQERRRQ
jgi:hypothetical protein